MAGQEWHDMPEKGLPRKLPPCWLLFLSETMNLFFLIALAVLAVSEWFFVQLYSSSIFNGFGVLALSCLEKGKKNTSLDFSSQYGIFLTRNFNEPKSDKDFTKEKIRFLLLCLPSRNRDRFYILFLWSTAHLTVVLRKHFVGIASSLTIHMLHFIFLLAFVHLTFYIFSSEQPNLDGIFPIFSLTHIPSSCKQWGVVLRKSRRN